MRLGKTARSGKAQRTGEAKCVSAHLNVCKVQLLKYPLFLKEARDTLVLRSEEFLADKICRLVRLSGRRMTLKS